MDVVHEAEGTAAVEAVGVDGQAVAHEVGRGVLPVLTVDVALYYMVPHRPQRLQRPLVVAEIRRPHVLRGVPQDVLQRIL